MKALFLTAFVSIPLTVAISALAVTDLRPVTVPFTQDLNLLRASLTLPVTDQMEKVTIPQRKLKIRAHNPKKDPTIEPLSINVPRSETGLRELVNRLAQKGKSKALQELLLEKMKKQGPSSKATVKIDLESKSPWSGISPRASRCDGAYEGLRSGCLHLERVSDSIELSSIERAACQGDT
ncbi:MAG: hypothetical protein ACOVS5_19085 [Oligoflexus sp.]